MLLTNRQTDRQTNATKNIASFCQGSNNGYKKILEKKRLFLFCVPHIFDGSKYNGLTQHE